jgi:ribosomal protein S6--L-glutamate ligase
MKKHNMSIAVISLGSISSQWLGKELQKFFTKVDMLDIRHIEVNLGEKQGGLFFKGEVMEQYDCVYAKGSYRYSNLLTSIATVLPKQTITPMTAQSFTIANDKLLTHLALQAQNIPMPKTYVAATTDSAKEILEKINYPIVMKFPQGTHGKGVMFADSFPSASSMLDALTALRQAFLIQEFVETGGIDIRAIVVGDKVVASMARKAAENELRSNVHAGGSAESYQLDFEASRVAVNSAHAVGAKICGVDLLIGPKGPVVMEVNSSPGLQGITKATGINIAEIIARYLAEETQKRKEHAHKKNADDIMKDINTPKNTIVTSLSVRAKRLLLPPVVTDISQLSEEDEVTIEVKKNEIIIKKLA